jgi:hypothetical protein
MRISNPSVPSPEIRKIQKRLEYGTQFTIQSKASKAEIKFPTENRRKDFTKCEECHQSDFKDIIVVTEKPTWILQ